VNRSSIDTRLMSQCEARRDCAHRCANRPNLLNTGVLFFNFLD
jgi:hypothetical protein